MAILGSATYKLNSDNTGLVRGLAKAERTTQESARRMAGNFAKIGVAGLAMGAAVGAGLFSLARAASDLQESTNAVNVVFGEGAQIIQKFSLNSAKAVGLAKSDFKQLSAITGALFKNFGLSEQEAAEQTITLTKRAADLASVHNTSVKDAMAALASGIRGETEPLRRYAADVSDATLELYLLKQGIDKSVTSMSQAEKGLLRFEVAMSATAIVEGDFARTQTDVANAAKITGAQIQNLKAVIGVGLLPVIEAVLPWVQSVVASLQLWAENNPKLMRAIVVAIAAVAVLAMGLGALLLAASAAMLIFAALGAAMLITIGQFALIALAVAALVAGIIWLIFNWETMVEWFKGLPLWAKIAAGALTLILLPAFIRLATMLVTSLARFVAWTVGWIAAQAVWLATSLARFVAHTVGWLAAQAVWLATSLARLAVWSATSLARFAVWSATSLARLAVWSATSLATFAVWIATSLVRFAVWSATSLATLAVWIARTLIMFMTWAKAMVVRWIIALGPIAWIIAGVAALGAAAVLLMMNWDSIDTRWRQLWDGLKVKAIGVMNAIIEKINALIRAWNSIPVVPDVGEIGKINPNSVGTPTLESALNFAGGAFGGPLLQLVGGGGLGSLLKKGAGLLGGTGGAGGVAGESPERWGIPGLAKGGIVTGPTFARLGEEGTEVVLPLDKLGKGMGLTVQVYMDGATILQANDAEEYVVDMVDRAVRRGVVLGAT